MPLLEPKDNENHGDFMDRCMADSVMQDEFPDDKQRLAVCQSQWDKEKDMAKDILERRAFDVLEMRVEGEDHPLIRGHAAVFNQLSVDLGGFREQIAPGAFKQSIKNDDIRALWNHNPDHVLGRNKSGTLTLSEDDVGLYIEIDPPNTQAGRDLVELVKRRDVSQMSFAFITQKDAWEHNDGQPSIRTLQKAQLFDVSPVTFAAYPQTDLKVRSALECAGIDYDVLADAVTAVRSGNATEEQRQAIGHTIDTLSELVQLEVVEPGGQEPRDTGTAGRVAMLRRRLQLVEL